MLCLADSLALKSAGRVGGRRRYFSLGGVVACGSGDLEILTPCTSSDSTAAARRFARLAADSICGADDWVFCV